MSEKEVIFLVQGCCLCGCVHEMDTEPHSYLYKEEGYLYDELTDPLTLEPLHDPVTLKSSTCRHVFSRDSIESAILMRGCCPIDNSVQTLADIERAPHLVNNLLDKLNVYCPNSCSATAMERHVLSHHLQVCPLSKVVCQRSFDGRICSVVVPRSEWPTHDLQCPLRRVVCKRGCDQQVLLADCDTHRCTKARRKRKELLEVESRSLKKIKVQHGLQTSRLGLTLQALNCVPFRAKAKLKHPLFASPNGAILLVLVHTCVVVHPAALA